MKVVCINNQWETWDIKEVKESYFWGFYKTVRKEKVPIRSAGPNKGDVLEVIKTKHDKANFSDEILLYYLFKEYKDWHDSRGFRPVDETEEQEADKKIEELLQTI